MSLPAKVSRKVWETKAISKFYREEVRKSNNNLNGTSINELEAN